MKPPAPSHPWMRYQLLLVLSPNPSDALAMSVHTCTLILSLQQPAPMDRSLAAEAAPCPLSGKHLGICILWATLDPLDQ